jgi:hypothetical protein
VTPVPPESNAQSSQKEAPPAEPLLSRISTSMGGAALASLACTGHAAARLASAGAGPWPKAWLALAACALLPALVLVIALPRALGVLATLDREKARARWVGLFSWLFAMQLGLLQVGTVLRRSTHHHALAGVTFAIVAVVAAVGLALVCARIAVVVTRNETVARVAVVASALLAVGALAFVARALSEIGRTSLIDAAAFFVAVGLASRAPRSTWVAFAGAPAAMLVLVLGTLFLRGSGALMAESIDALAPLYEVPASFLAGR